MDKEYRYFMRLGKYKVAIACIIFGIVFCFYKYATNRSFYRFMYLIVMNEQQSKIFFGV